jgi:hypothetical protein
MALTDPEIADITVFLGLPSLDHLNAVKIKINQALALQPTLTEWKENQIRDLIRSIKQTQKDLKACEQMFGQVRSPGTVINSPERVNMLMAAGRNTVAQLEVIINCRKDADIFSRGRGSSGANVRRG